MVPLETIEPKCIANANDVSDYFFFLQRHLIRLACAILLPAVATFIHAVIQMSEAGGTRNEVKKIHKIFETFKERHNFINCIHVEAALATLYSASNW